MDPDTLRYAAFEVCKDFVREQLKAPATAKFRNFFEDDGEVVVAGGPADFTVQSTVDSENSFGALLRSTFVCSVRSVGGDTWQLTNLQLSP